LPVTGYSISESLPASAAQARYVRGVESDGRCNVNLGLGIDLPTDASVYAVRDAVNRISRRHESLRTTLIWSGGEVRRIVAPPDHVPPPDVEHVNAAASLGEAATTLLNRPFELGSGPAYRCAILETARARRLALILHHSMVDAASCRLLADELVATLAYTGAASGQPAREAGQYREFVENEIGLETEERMSFWARELRHSHDCPPILLGREVVSNGPLVAVPAPYEISRPDVEMLRTRARALGYGLGVVLTAIVARAFADREPRELRLGFAHANRRGARARDMVGLVAEILPVRIGCSTGSTIDEVTSLVHRRLRRNLQQQMSLGAIMRSMDAGRQPPFEIHVNFLPASVSGAKAGHQSTYIPTVVDLEAERRRVVTAGLALAPVRIKFVERGDGKLLVIIESVGATFSRQALLDVASHLVESAIAAARGLKSPSLGLPQ
jgi:hypothetical protein